MPARSVLIVSLGAIPDQVSRAAECVVATRFGVDARIDPRLLDPTPYYSSARDQYYSTAILESLSGLPSRWSAPQGGTRILDSPSRLDEGTAPPEGRVKVLGVTGLDLFIPILTFVFGEAMLGGTSAVVSTHRLHDSFYGLPDNAEVLLGRLEKEAVHELGHTFGLVHCRDFECVMHSSRGVEEVDIKSSEFCDNCAASLRLLE